MAMRRLSRADRDLLGFEWPRCFRFAAITLGQVGDQRQFPTRDRFAASQTAPPYRNVERATGAASAQPAGNRQLNHALHLIAVTEIGPRHPGPRVPRTETRRREVEEGSAPGAQALPQRRRLAPTPGRSRASMTSEPGRARGDDSEASVTGSAPSRAALRRSHSRAQPARYARIIGHAASRQNATLDSQEASIRDWRRHRMPRHNDVVPVALTARRTGSVCSDRQPLLVQNDRSRARSAPAFADSGSRDPCPPARKSGLRSCVPSSRRYVAASLTTWRRWRRHGTDAVYAADPWR
jgi:hypothetical protein